MEELEITQLKKRIKYSNIIIAVLILLSIGCFFYGMINNVRMKQERAMAIQIMEKHENLMRENKKLSEQLESMEENMRVAQQEAIMAKDIALDNAERARNASEKATKK